RTIALRSPCATFFRSLGHSRAHAPPAPTLSGAAVVRGARLLHERGGVWVAVAGELLTPQRLVVLPDPFCRLTEREERNEETVVRFVAGRNRAVPLPSRAAQRIQPSVISGARVSVGGDRLAAAQRLPSEQRPRVGHIRVGSSNLSGALARGE